MTTTFSALTYSQIEVITVKSEFEKYLQEIKSSTNIDDLMNALNKLNDLRNEIASSASLASIRHSQNTKDSFYEKEQNFWDENSPIFSDLENKLQKILLNHSLKNEISEKVGEHLLNIAAVNEKIFIPEIADLLIEENKKCTEYSKILAEAKLIFEGKEYTLSGIAPFLQDTLQERRKNAAKARAIWFSSQEQKLDDIFSTLITIRTQIAKKLGFKSFVELAYARLNRTDYDANDVAVFRAQVQAYLVPLASSIREKQRQRLQLETLYSYDENIFYKNGNPKPIGTPKDLIEKALTMYRLMNVEFGDFFSFMVDHELLDVESRENKMVGGYCTYIPTKKMPFIFSNFNGTTADIDVLTHEAGHAFQVYCSQHFSFPEYHWPTMEACEIHSMSMEYFAYPYMTDFVGKDDAQKYCFEHMSSSILFIPYGVAVDEFQHLIYTNPQWTALERKQCWQSLEQKYLPSKNYDDLEYYNNGNLWQGQSHIFVNPFYYIDYTLASICAFQFWKKFNDEKNTAIKNYIHLCKLGGSLPFSKLVNEAQLISPFDKNCIISLLKDVSDYLEKTEKHIVLT